MGLPVHLRALAPAALLLALVGCVEGETAGQLPPLDRFYFPMGVATTRLDGGKTALLVASTNYDLRYSGEEGGTLLSVDPFASPVGGALAVFDGERIPSYSGPLAVADGTRCAGTSSETAPSVLVASRLDDRIYRFAIDPASGALTCDGCARETPSGFDDPFAVAVACGAGGNHAFVGYLDPPESTRGHGLGSWITELDLDAPLAPARQIELGDGLVRAMALDARTDRLWAATHSSGPRALLHSVPLGDPRWEGAAPWEAVDTVDLYPFVRGAELRSIAVGSSPAAGSSRLFLTARLYDAESQDSTGVRPLGDVGGVLIVLDVADGADGHPRISVRAVESIGLGVGDVAVIRRAGKADLAVATAADEDLLVVYDDETGTVLHAVAHNGSGIAILGDRPLGVAVGQIGTGVADVFVTGFGSHIVTRFQLDPDAPSAPLVLIPFGGLSP
jgi:hypothetical protein